MNFRSKGKTLSFIGLFFLASISLHSFAHIDEAPVKQGPQIECQSCHNEISAEIEIFTLTLKVDFHIPVDQKLPQNFYLQPSKPFYSQAPPKIKI